MRVLMKADDFGRYTANAKLLKAALFPYLVDSITEANVEVWKRECAEQKLIVVYEVDGKQFLFIPKFGQRIRPNAKPKFPDPPGEQSEKTPQDAAGRGENPPFAHAHCALRMSYVGMRNAEAQSLKNGEVDSAKLPSRYQLPALREAYEAFATQRAEGGKPISEVQYQSFLKSFDEWGEEASIESLRMAIGGGYVALKAPTKKKPKAKPLDKARIR